MQKVHNLNDSSFQPSHTMLPSHTTLITWLLLLACAQIQRCLAVLGSRVTVHNESPILLRIVSSTIYKDHDTVYFLPNSSSIAMQGYSNGKPDPDDQHEYGYDVTFTLQRFCPGITTLAESTLQDGWRDVAYFIATNHWYGVAGRL